MHHFVVQNPQVNGAGGDTKQVSVGGYKGQAAHMYHCWGGLRWVGGGARRGVACKVGISQDTLTACAFTYIVSSVCPSAGRTSDACMRRPTVRGIECASGMLLG